MQRIVGEDIAEIVNIKIGRVGGLTKARRLRDKAVANSMRVLVMATGGSAVADTDAAHLAQSTPPKHRIATWLCQDMPSVDPAPPDRGARNVDGAAAANLDRCRRSAASCPASTARAKAKRRFAPWMKAAGS